MADNDDSGTSDRIFRIDDVIILIRTSRSTLWREIKAGRFPRPVSISKRCKGWLESEVKTGSQSGTASDSARPLPEHAGGYRPALSPTLSRLQMNDVDHSTPQGAVVRPNGPQAPPSLIALPGDWSRHAHLGDVRSGT